jgi:hypothetical protein
MERPDHMNRDTPTRRDRMDRATAMRIVYAVVVALAVVVLAGGAVEIVNHTGIITGLGFTDQIARAIADTGAFAMTGAVLYGAWRR